MICEQGHARAVLVCSSTRQAEHMTLMSTIVLHNFIYAACLPRRAGDHLSKPHTLLTSTAWLRRKDTLLTEPLLPAPPHAYTPHACMHMHTHMHACMHLPYNHTHPPLLPPTPLLHSHKTSLAQPSHPLPPSAMSAGEQLTALRFDDAGLHMAVGTGNGLVGLFDLRSQRPLLVKDHMYGDQIMDIKFTLAGEGGLATKRVMSADKHIVKVGGRGGCVVGGLCEEGTGVVMCWGGGGCAVLPIGVLPAVLHPLPLLLYDGCAGSTCCSCAPARTRCNTARCHHHTLTTP